MSSIPPDLLQMMQGGGAGLNPAAATPMGAGAPMGAPPVSPIAGVQPQEPQPSTSIATPQDPKTKKLTRGISDKGDPETQVLTFVTPHLSDERWDEVQNYVTYILRQAIANRSQLDADLKNFNDLYEGAVPADKSTPWEGCANINVPITQEMLDGLHSRLAKSALGITPLALVKGEDEMGVEVEFKLERYYESLAKAIDLEEALSTAVFLGLRDGVGLLKIMWDQRKRKVRTRKMKPIMDEMGQLIFDPMTQQPLREEKVEVDEVTEWDNVRVVAVEFKDFYVLPAHAYDITRNFAKGVAERFWSRYDELKQKAASGMYRKKKVDMLREASSLNRAAIETEHAEHIHVEVFSQYEGFYEFELFDVYMNYDLDEDGYEEECVFTISPQFNIMLRAEVFPYWHQLRPYVPVIPWPRPRRFPGFSVPQRLEPIQRELNAIHNQRLDAVSIRLSPPMLISRSANMRGDGGQTWGPGARLEVNDINEVEFPSLPDINPSSFSEETILRQYAERIIGLYDVNTPRGTGSRRTRAEIGAIQSEGMVRFDYMMKLVQRAIVQVFEQIHQLKIQYMPEQETFEAVGLENVQKFNITRPEMLANIKFLANGDLPVQDKEQNRQDAYFLYQALMANPLVVNDITKIYQVTKKLLQAWEEKAPEKYIGRQEDVMMMAQQQAAQAQMGGGAAGGGPQQQQTQGGATGARGQSGLASTPTRPAGGPK